MHRPPRHAEGAATQPHHGKQPQFLVSAQPARQPLSRCPALPPRRRGSVLRAGWGFLVGGLRRTNVLAVSRVVERQRVAAEERAPLA